jgi:hypothetical protein
MAPLMTNGDNALFSQMSGFAVAGGSERQFVRRDHSGAGAAKRASHATALDLS